MSAPDSVVDVDAVLETARFCRLSLIVTACASAVLILDGFDIQVIGMAAPALVNDLGIEHSALAPTLAASLFGMALGASTIGAVGDRWGRRPALLLSTLLFGGATLLAATATTVVELSTWRFITGLGLGGALPSATALLAEFTSRRQRSQVLGLSLIGVPLGGILGAMLAAEIVPAHGWRAIFVVGGLLPMLAAVAMHFVMPESPRYLASRGHRPDALAALLSRIDEHGRYSDRDRFVLSATADPMHSTGVRAIFAPNLRWDAIITALAFLTNIFAVFAFFNWAPLVLTSIGLAFDAAMRSALVFNLAGIAGTLAISIVIARIGSRLPLATCAIAATLALAGVGFLTRIEAPSSNLHAALLIGIAIAGATISAIQVGMYTVAAHVFPTPCRSSGIGWALGSGRMGGILSAFAGGLLLTQAGATGFFGGVGVALLFTFATVVLLRRHIPRPEIEESHHGSSPSR